MKTNYNSLINDISKSLNSIYLLYGDEQYLVQTAINRIKKQGTLFEIVFDEFSFDP